MLSFRPKEESSSDGEVQNLHLPGLYFTTEMSSHDRLTAFVTSYALSGRPLGKVYLLSMLRHLLSLYKDYRVKVPQDIISLALVGAVLNDVQIFFLHEQELEILGRGLSYCGALLAKWKKGRANRTLLGSVIMR